MKVVEVNRMFEAQGWFNFANGTIYLRYSKALTRGLRMNHNKCFGSIEDD